MASARIFCIGDVHAQTDKLDRLLARLDAIDAGAELWFVGDLVNRGPDSAGVIRRVRALGSRAVTLLGNHDLAALALTLACPADQIRGAGGEVAAADLLAADDSADLIHWLRHRQLIHHCRESDWTMVHAGLPGCWSLAQAEDRAREFEAALVGDDWRTMLTELYGNTPAHWADAVTPAERLRYIANALTRQRFCDAVSGALALEYKRDIAGAPSGLVPWFAAKGRRSAGQRIVFGHWSALGRIAWPEHNVWCVDTGAPWGGALTAMELAAHPRFIQVD